MALRLDGVTKHFGGIRAVENVSLVAGERDFVVLLGPSGSGKSTLLRMIAGLETVTSGMIEINGRRVDHLEPIERNIAFVFQTYALYPHMTVRRNIAFPLIMQRASFYHHLPLIGGLLKRRIENLPEVRERTEAVARSIGLGDMLDRHPRTLSGGQRQRVAVGRALVRDPSVFLMDEPLSNLDAQLRVDMRAQIIRLFDQVGRTFVYVTHDQIEAMTMATMVVVLDRGSVQQIGPPKKIYEHPANIFVARFIGSPPMNIFRGRRMGLSFRTDEGGLSLPLPALILDQVSDGNALQMGARPEDITVVANAADGNCAATVSTVEHLGSETLIGFVLGGDWRRGYGQEARDSFARVPAYSNLEPGRPIAIRFDTMRLAYFSPDSGRNLNTTSI
jgi:multiple sugar transport system ATP-binding protein